MEREDISFVDQRFLETRLLDESNVLEYFSASPFYDRSCNNEVLKMQTQFRGLDQKSKLSTMVGMFYEVQSSSADRMLFVIRKAHNHGNRTETTGMYYIVHGYVYPAPTNHSLYRCRMSDAMWSLHSFICKMAEKKRFNPFNPNRVGYSREPEDDSSLRFAMEIFADFRKRLDSRNDE